MDVTGDSCSWQQFPALSRSYRQGRQAKALALEEAKARTTAAEAPPIPKNPERSHAGVEDLTAQFRSRLAKKHAARVAEEAKRHALAQEEWIDVLTGEAPEHPCKNLFWSPGAERPPRAAHRCTSVKKIRGVAYRCGQLAGHEGDHRASKFRVECPCASCVLRDSMVTKTWHEERRDGQRARFDRVRSCGSRMRTASCGLCGTDRRAVPEGCGVRRVCSRCDAIGAMARRARFGRARGRAFVDGVRYGLFRTQRRGGRYTEKMLTLTIPHATLEDARALERPAHQRKDAAWVADLARDTLHARCVALFEAWPRFLRKVNRHWKACKQSHVTYHRAFEWTPGRADEHGHPHYHVYLWCPWIDVRLLRAWWAEALLEVGWPVTYDDDGSPVLRIKLQMLRSFGVDAVRELMKGGKRSALTLSRLEFIDPAAGAEFARGLMRGQQVGPGIDAFKYAEGWTLASVEDCSDEVRARLYMALEAKRLTQASRAFFVDDPRASCECCGASMFRVRFQGTKEDGERIAVPFDSWLDRRRREAQRGPPALAAPLVTFAPAPPPRPVSPQLSFGDAL